MLVEMGCEVVGPVATVAEAERAANSQQLDGAILDVNLRGTHIFGVLPVFQRQRIPVILSSGYADPDLYPPEFRGLPLLVKPYDAGEFAKLVNKVFGPPAPR